MTSEDLKPGWIVWSHSHGQWFVYTGGGHYDFIDLNNNGWDTKWVCEGPITLVTEESFNELGMARDDFIDACETSYHTITAGRGYKNPKPWWESWSPQP